MEAALLAPTLTDEGRRFMATLCDTPELQPFFSKTATRTALRRIRHATDREREDAPRAAGRTNLRSLLRRPNMASFADFEEALDKAGRAEANAILSSTLESWSHLSPREGQHKRALAIWLVCYAFDTRLPFTSSTPPTWWWPLLENVLCPPHAYQPWPCFYRLPSTFLPAHRLINFALYDDADCAGEATLCAGSTPQMILELCEHPALQNEVAASGLEAVLRARHDLPALTPLLLSCLLGHKHPALAALGLELATGHGAQRQI
jgi:hypothetical protein